MSITPITGDHETDAAIAKWVKGLYASWEVECLIISAQAEGVIPAVDADGRTWTSGQIMEYALTITPRPEHPCSFCDTPTLRWQSGTPDCGNC